MFGLTSEELRKELEIKATIRGAYLEAGRKAGEKVELEIDELQRYKGVMGLKGGYRLVESLK